MTTNYQRGAAFENSLKKRLQIQGYYVARCAGSHTPIDLVAIKQDSILLIQCKSSKVEELPDVKQLLKSFIEEGSLSRPSNVYIFQTIPVPGWSRKLIIWKGTGRSNYFTFTWNGSTWNVERGLVW